MPSSLRLLAISLVPILCRAFVETPKRQKKLLPAISFEQLKALLGCCHNDRDKVPVNPFFRCLLFSL